MASQSGGKSNNTTSKKGKPYHSSAWKKSSKDVAAVLSYQYRVFFLSIDSVTNVSGAKKITENVSASGKFSNMNAELRFSAISEASNTTEVKDYKEGGQNEFKHMFPDGTSAEQITLSRGLLKSTTIEVLRNYITNDKEEYHKGKFAMMIAFYPRPNTKPFFLHFTKVWPVKLEFGALGSTSSEVVVEKLTLSVKQVKRFLS